MATKYCVNYELCHEFRINSTNSGILKSVNERFTCSSHEEADTKIIYHICNTDRIANFSIVCSDTDILIILLGNLHKISKESKVFIVSGTQKNRLVINVTALYETLEPELCKSLMAFHALTGCDYNPSFFRRAKTNPYKVLLKNKNYQLLLGELGEKSLGELQEDFLEVQKFVCEFYGFKRKKTNDALTVNLARFGCFMKSYRIKDSNNTFSKKSLKSFDAACIPPCERELYQHFLRTYYITKVWANADKKVPLEIDDDVFVVRELNPTDCGWIQDDNGFYEFNWFDGPQLPETIEDVLTETDGKNQIFYFRSTAIL